MFSSFSLPFSFSPFTFTKEHIKLDPVKVHDVETAPDKTSKRLRSLLKLNHANHSIIYNELRFHNHVPHILGSSYILGATSDQLNQVYDAESANLEPWKDSPGEISKEDWRDFLGKRDYQRAYIDFFEDALVSFGYDWKKLLEHYLYEGDEPLANTLVSGLGHPLIHLGYAYEINSRTVAIEALALGTCFYSSLHKYIDDPSYTHPASYTSPSALSILQKIANDTHLDNLFSTPGAENIDPLLEKKGDVIVDHWNAWDVTPENLHDRLHSAQEAAVALVVATHTGAKNYDFFLLHVLTTSHAVRILLPIVPAKFRLSLVRQWFLFAIIAYVGQLRPQIDLNVIDGFEPEQGKDSWKYVTHVALTGQHNADAHFVKGLRAMMVAEETWGNKEGWWLKAGCKLAAEFNGWGGLEA